MSITLTIVDLNITDLSILTIYRQQLRIDKPFIGCEVKFLVTHQHLFMQTGIDFDGITLHQLTGCFVVAFTLDTLYLSQQTGNPRN